MKQTTTTDSGLELTCPGSYPEHHPVTGVPRCGLTYVRHSSGGAQQPAVDVQLGQFTGGGGALALTFTSVEELDAVGEAVLEARAHLSMWIADHRPVKVSAA